MVEGLLLVPEEGKEMHKTDPFVVVVLLLASGLAIKFAPAAVVMLLVTLVRYRKAAS